MKQFYDKEEYDYNDIDFLINNEVEESIYLDFKEAGAIDRTESKRKEISKDVASFANSDGGIIVYGIKENEHKASSLSFIDGNEYTKEWLEEIINSNVRKHIEGLRIFPIRYNGEIEKTIYIVKIPMSIDAPHISKDNRFYRRFNFQSVPMEEYEIRSLYGRKNKSKLEISLNMIYPVPSERYDEYFNFSCEVNIINIGNVVETTYKLNVYFNNFSEYMDFYGDKNSPQLNYTITNKCVKFSSFGASPIFPNEEVNGIRFNFKIQKNKLVEALTDVKIVYQLLFSNGEDKLNADLTGLIEEVLSSEKTETGLLSPV